MFVMFKLYYIEVYVSISEESIRMGDNEENEFSFHLRDRILHHFSHEDLNKLQLQSDYSLVDHPKEILIDIITYCSMNDFNQAKLSITATIKLLTDTNRAFIVQKLVWYYWKRCFIKTKFAIEKDILQLQSCKDYHSVLHEYSNFLSNFNGFNWTWYLHFTQEIVNLKLECTEVNNQLNQ